MAWPPRCSSRAAGVQVDLFEKQERLGGRTAALRTRFTGSTSDRPSLMMKSLLDRIFTEAGKNSADYLDFVGSTRCMSFASTTRSSGLQQSGGYEAGN